MSDIHEFQPMSGMDREAINAHGYGMVQYGPGDDRLVVGFFPKAVLNRSKSQASGKPIYEQVEYIKIQQPGERLNIVERESTEHDRARFPRQYQAFLKGRSQAPEGTPISILFPSSPEIVATLTSCGVHTVQQLANLSAHGISTVGMGATEWVTKAQGYIKQSEKGVDYHHFEKVNEEQLKRIAMLERQIGDMNARFAQVMAQGAGKVAPGTIPFEPDFDAQQAMIDNRHVGVVASPQYTPDLLPPPAPPAMHRGRPKGSRNRPKENF